MNFESIFSNYVSKVEANPKLHCICLAERLAKEFSEYSESKKLLVFRNKAGALEHIGAPNSGWLVHCAVLVGGKVYDPWFGQPLPVVDYLPSVYNNSDLLRTEVREWGF